MFGRMLLCGTVLMCLTSTASAQVHVDGYMRQDGTVVTPHYRSWPDSTPTNNYSYPGNTNPYTGHMAPGTPPALSPFSTSPPSMVPSTSQPLLSPQPSPFLTRPRQR